LSRSIAGHQAARTYSILHYHGGKALQQGNGHWISRHHLGEGPISQLTKEVCCRFTEALIDRLPCHLYPQMRGKRASITHAHFSALQQAQDLRCRKTLAREFPFLHAFDKFWTRAS